MNNGDDTDYYLKKGFKVVAIDANPHLCRIAGERFRQYLENGDLRILNVAISEKVGKSSFYLNLENDHWSSLDIKWASRNNSKTQTIAVQAARLDQIIEQYGLPYYVKIDIEGGDKIALSQILSHTRQIPYISIEDCRLGFEYIKMLSSFGYNKFKLVNQSLVYANPDKEISYSFRLGSSGLFGESLTGNWYSYEDFYEYYSKVARDPSTLIKIAEPSVWWDIHAAL